MNFIKLIIPPIFSIILNKLKSIVATKNKNIKGNNGSIKYKIGKYVVNLPIQHTLPTFQKNNRLYDRFLPILVKNLESSNKLIIDIGANVGDTPIAIIQNCKNPLLCIEPSDFFFSYLEMNINNLSSIDKKRVQCVKNIIGTGNYNGILAHSAGTASVQSNNINNDVNGSDYVSLDDLIEEKENIGLIKVDTDGFDFDVLISAQQILRKSGPILFWENQMFKDFQIKGYVDLYHLLSKCGYKYIYVFDNFGNIIIEETDFNTLIKINKYVISMDQGLSTRTFFYTDILACTEKNYDNIKKSMLDYKNFIKNNSKIL